MSSTVIDQVKKWQSEHPGDSLASALKAIGATSAQYYYQQKAKKKGASKAASVPVTRTRAPRTTAPTTTIKPTGHMALVYGTPDQIRQLMINGL